MTKKITVFGIDPGYDRCGFAIVSKTPTSLEVLDYGHITSDKSNTFEERLVEIGNDFKSLLEQYNPDYVFIEQVFFSKNKTTSLLIAQVIGVLTYITGAIKTRVETLHPLTIKKSITGTGKATKKQIEFMVEKLYKEKFNFQIDDVADAFAIALVGLGKISYSISSV